MKPRLRRFGHLVGVRLATGVGVAVVAGAALLALASFVEHGAAGLLARTLEVLPVTMPFLVGVGAWSTARRARARGELLALAAAGRGPTGWILAGALVGGVVALGVGWVAARHGTPQEGWVRGVGGWWQGAVSVPDVPGGSVGPASAPAFAWVRAVVAGALAGALGVGWGGGAGR